MRAKFPERNNRLIMRWLSGQTMGRIADDLGVTRNVVAGVLKRAGLFAELAAGAGVVETPLGLRRAKFTHEQAQEVRAKYIPGVYGYARIAKEYDVSVDAIAQIIRGKSHASS